MKKRRKTAIVLLILIIGIAGWQAYSYIERATRPEPAVVYKTVGFANKGSKLAGKFTSALGYLTIGKLDYSKNDVSTWVCSADGNRKWLVEKTKSDSTDGIAPFYDYLQIGSDSECVFFDETSGYFNSQPQYYAVNLNSGKSRIIESTFASGFSFTDLYYPIHRLDGSKHTYYYNFLGFGSSTKPIILYRWDEQECDIEPIEDSPLARLQNEGYIILNVYTNTFGDILCIPAKKLIGNTETTHLFLIDIKKRNLADHWIFPATTDELDFIPQPEPEESYQRDSLERKYAVAGTPHVISPPNPDDQITLVRYYSSYLKTNPKQKLSRGIVIYSIDLDDRSVETIDFPPWLPKDEDTGHPLLKTGACKFSFYDATNKIAYMSFAVEGKGKYFCGLRCDGTWTDPLPILGGLCNPVLVQDGSIWDVELTAGDRQCLVRYDPATDEKKTISVGDVVSICFALD